MKRHRWFCTFFPPALLVLVLFFFACKTSPPSAPADTAPSVRITSPISGEVSRLTDTVFVDATDDKAVTKVELYINGSLAGTDESAPWRFIWNTELWDDGGYTLTATAYDGGGHSTTSDPVTMSISNAFPATFVNATYTTMSITVSGVQRSISSGDSITYTFSTNPRSFDFTASTSGTTNQGTQVGVLLQWAGSSIDVSSYTSYRTRLVVSSNYFFMYMNNTGKTTLGPIYVNYGLTSQTKDNILIPGDGQTYRTGYYRAYTNTQVRAYWSYPTTTYSYWNQGTHFTLPWTTNQSVILSNTYPTSKVGGAANFATSEAAPPFEVLAGVPRVMTSAVLRVPNDGAVIAYPRE